MDRDRDLLEGRASCSVPEMRRWHVHELQPALHRLMQRIEAERLTFTGGPPFKRFPRKELAAHAGVSAKTYSRYLDGSNMPLNEEGVERLMMMADAVGISREEAESYLPPALESVPLDGNNMVKKDVLEELLAEVRKNGALLEEIVHMLRSSALL